MLTALQLFKFTKDTKPNSWTVVLDGVMGGNSDGTFQMNSKGNAVFSGTISLENNGGFSSIRSSIPSLDIKGKSTLIIRCKGDEKKYQLRLKTNRSDRHSYIAYFETSGKWQTIKIPIKEMEPSFRGMKLNMPNFPAEQLEEISFLFGNKKEESFQLILDEISLE